MTLETDDGSDDTHSLGIDAVNLDRYSAIESEEGELILYDERSEDAWIQSDRWIPPTSVG